MLPIRAAPLVQRGKLAACPAAAARTAAWASGCNYFFGASTTSKAEPLIRRSSSCIGGMRGSGATEIDPVQPVVGHEHPVLLQPLEDRLHVGREAVDGDSRPSGGCARPSAAGSGRSAGWRSAWPDGRRPGATSAPSPASHARPCRASTRRSGPRRGRSAARRRRSRSSRPAAACSTSDRRPTPAPPASRRRS